MKFRASLAARRACVAAAVAGAVAVGLPQTAYAGVRKGPFLQDLTATSVDVRVELDGASPARLEVTHEKDPPKVVRADPSSFHMLRVSGLAPATPYHYRVEAGGAAFDGTFTTAPADDAATPFTFVLYGDDRTDDASHASVVRAIEQVPSDFLVNTGDLVQDGSEDDLWQRFFSIEGSLLRDRPLFAAIGNHELVEETASHFLRYFGPLPEPGDGGAPLDGAHRLYRTVRWENTRFFFLNGQDTFSRGDEIAWLKDELTRAKTEPGLLWRVAVVHHAPWSAGPHGMNERMQMGDVPRLLKDAGVDVLFGGHDHIYERGEAKGIKYIISGGGGAPLYPIREALPSTLAMESVHHFLRVDVTPARMAFTVRRVDGSVLETCAIVKRDGGSAWDCAPKVNAAAAVVSVKDTTPPSDKRDAAQPSRCGCELPGSRSRASAASAWAALVAFASALAARRLLRRGSAP